MVGIIAGGIEVGGGDSVKESSPYNYKEGILEMPKKTVHQKL